MKFNPTWTQVALIAALLASVVGSHLWAPTAVAVITSLVSTIIGSLFVNLKDKGNEEMIANLITGVLNATGQYKRVETTSTEGTKTAAAVTTASAEVHNLPELPPPAGGFGNPNPEFPEPFGEIQNEKKENKS